MKHFSRFATRHDHRTIHFEGLVYLVSAMIFDECRFRLRLGRTAAWAAIIAAKEYVGGGMAINCQASCHYSGSAYNDRSLNIIKNGLAPSSSSHASGTMIDTRFSTALHIMAIVAINQERTKRTTSQSLASSLGANASFVRKLLGPLVEAELLKVNIGGRGGIFLARPSNSILISDIYKAAAPEKKIWETRSNLPCACLVSRNIVSLSDLLLDKAQRSMLESLSELSLNCVVEKLKGFDEQTSS